MPNLPTYSDYKRAMTFAALTGKARQENDATGLLKAARQLMADHPAPQMVTSARIAAATFEWPVDALREAIDKLPPDHSEDSTSGLLLTADALEALARSLGGDFAGRWLGALAVARGPLTVAEVLHNHSQWNDLAKPAEAPSEDQPEARQAWEDREAWALRMLPTINHGSVPAETVLNFLRNKYGRGWRDDAGRLREEAEVRAEAERTIAYVGRKVSTTPTTGSKEPSQSPTAAPAVNLPVKLPAPVDGAVTWLRGFLSEDVTEAERVAVLRAHLLKRGPDGLVLDSLQVAELFEMRHDNVLQTIRRVLDRSPEYLLNFQEQLETYAMGEGLKGERTRTVYQMNRKGFTRLVASMQTLRAHLFTDAMLLALEDVATVARKYVPSLREEQNEVTAQNKGSSHPHAIEARRQASAAYRERQKVTEPGAPN